jgi:hypothetical protein
MVARNVQSEPPTRRNLPVVSTPLLWRALIAVNRVVIGVTGRLEVTGDIPASLRGRPLLLASNHIGNLDPLVLVAACRRIHVMPRFMLAGGLLDAPVVGPLFKVAAQDLTAAFTPGPGNVLTSQQGGNRLHGGHANALVGVARNLAQLGRDARRRA